MSSKKTMMAAATASAALFVVSAANAVTGSPAGATGTPVPIADPGFEAVSLSPGASGYFGFGTLPAPGWVVGGVYGGNIYDPGAGSASFPGGAPEGDNVFTMGSETTLSQTLATALAAGVYDMSVYIGNEADRGDPASTTAFQLYLPSTGRVILSSIPLAMSTITNGGFAEVSALGSVQLGDADIGDAMAIRISTTAMPTEGTTPYFAYDDVRLDVSPVPEPSELALMLAGVGLLGWQMRKRINSGL